MVVPQYSSKPKVAYASISVRVPVKLKQDFYAVMDADGNTPYKFLQDAIKQKISGNVGGKTISFKFEYNAATDSFDWIEFLEKGRRKPGRRSNCCSSRL